MSIKRLSTGSISSTTPKGSKVWDQETFPGTFESISTAIVDSSGASSITFSNIPQNYTHLQIRGIVKHTSSDGLNILFIRMNNNSGTNYSGHSLYGTGSSALATSGTSQTYGWAGRTSTPKASLTSIFGAFIIDILDYTSTNKNKTIRSLAGVDANGSGAVELTSSLWFATPAAVTQIDLYDEAANFAQYSSFALYGIRGA